ncbi:2'-5' RNA ligase family protein [Tropicimonas sp. IMCC34011]|uniref:2'-5' RNA ligase family protein n=1 Tax=Tropicimonas sp. IMCC34011 TaxID=2248759 RepID=UPI001E28B00B|nr:2'-5' RNA ligase family protein [Tropicimonas sp. IMCC34011]
MIVTLGFDARSFARLDAERQALFPDRGYRLPAHLTLFHHLPGARQDLVQSRLAVLAARTRPPRLAFSGIREIGGGQGSAYAVRSPALLRLRADLARLWAPWLTRQDRRAFRPHITVQNKVPHEEGRAAREALLSRFVPFRGTGTALILCHYRGGPWERAGEWPFGAP